jgi:hypothetical protein
MFKWLRSYKYSVCLHNAEYHYSSKDNWREIVKWCEETYDKDNYTCDIIMNGNKAHKVIVKFKLKEDYTQLVLTWC